jgi:predicted glycosyltransferase
MRIWIDVDNPPQVQYLAPFESVFRAGGADVVVTARDYGNTYELLDSRGISYHPVGSSFGARRWQKAAGLARRSQALLRFFRDRDRPDALLCAGRVSALVARRLRIPSFVITDYEYVNVGFYRLTGSCLVHPDVIDAEAFVSRGIRPDRLIAFRGLKEDVSFRGFDRSDVPAHEFPELRDRSLVRLLFRPAAEESHYYRSASGDLALELLRHLAGRREAVVVFSPRYPWQEEYLGRFRWANEPVILREAVPFASLLRGVDLVVSSGGTMAREAAYLGVPSYSIFQGRLGGVDRHLAALGRLHLIRSTEDFTRIELRPRGQEDVLRSNPDLAEQIAGLVLTRAQSGRRASVSSVFASGSEAS